MSDPTSVDNFRTLAFDFLSLQRQIKPLFDQSEALKPRLRAFPGQKEDFAGVGSVSVSQPTESSSLGFLPVFDAEKFAALDDATKALLTSRGVVRFEEKVSRAAASSVTCRLNV